MFKEERGKPIYAVAFNRSSFDPKLLPVLKGLPNLRQVQLAGTSVSDDDMRHLAELRILTGLGLDQTAITDAGLKTLRSLPHLIDVECEGTQITEQGLQEVLKPVP